MEKASLLLVSMELRLVKTKTNQKSQKFLKKMVCSCSGLRLWNSRGVGPQAGTADSALSPEILVPAYFGVPPSVTWHGRAHHTPLKLWGFWHGGQQSTVYNVGIGPNKPSHSELLIIELTGEKFYSWKTIGFAIL